MAPIFIRHGLSRIVTAGLLGERDFPAEVAILAFHTQSYFGFLCF